MKSVFWEPIRSGTDVGSGCHSAPTFWRMNDIPIAVINGASFGALRNGLYATRSIITFSEPVASMLTTSTPAMPRMITITDEPALMPSQVRHRYGDERAEHEHVAVGEVDQLDDPVDERVAERDQRPDRPVRDPGLDVVEASSVGSWNA